MHLARGGVSLSLGAFLVAPVMYHLWFVYMMLGIYLLLPIIRPLFKSLCESKDYLIYFFTFWFVVTSIPVYWPIPQLQLLQQTSLLGYGGYFLLGGVICARSPAGLSSRTWSTIFVGAVAVTASVTWYKSAGTGVPDETGFLYFSPNVIIASIAAFILLSRMRVKGKWRGVVRYVSDQSFIIFFVHVLVLEYVRYNPVMIAAAGVLPVGIHIVIVSVMSFVLSVLISSAIRIIPGASHVFG